MQQRLLVEASVVQVFDLQTRRRQTVIDGVSWKRRIVFDSREPFFLSRRDDPTIHNQRRSGIMEECRKAKDRGQGCAPRDEPGTTDLILRNRYFLAPIRMPNTKPTTWATLAIGPIAPPRHSSSHRTEYTT